jgi:hypothetical protein
MHIVFELSDPDYEFLVSVYSVCSPKDELGLFNESTHTAQTIEPFKRTIDPRYSGFILAYYYLKDSPRSGKTLPHQGKTRKDSLTYPNRRKT